MSYLAIIRLLSKKSYIHSTENKALERVSTSTSKKIMINSLLALLLFNTVTEISILFLELIIFFCVKFPCQVFNKTQYRVFSEFYSFTN